MRDSELFIWTESVEPPRDQLNRLIGRLGFHQLRRSELSQSDNVLMKWLTTWRCHQQRVLRHEPVTFEAYDRARGSRSQLIPCGR